MSDKYFHQDLHDLFNLFPNFTDISKFFLFPQVYPPLSNDFEQFHTDFFKNEFAFLIAKGSIQKNKILNVCSKRHISAHDSLIFYVSFLSFERWQINWINFRTEWWIFKFFCFLDCLELLVKVEYLEKEDGNCGFFSINLTAKL